MVVSARVSSKHQHQGWKMLLTDSRHAQSRTSAIATQYIMACQYILALKNYPSHFYTTRKICIIAGGEIVEGKREGKKKNWKKN